MKLTLLNFKSYKNDVYTFGNGESVHVIKGPSGCGKTTLFDAILFALTGQGKKITTFGARKTSVTFEFDDTFKVTRSTSPASVVVTTGSCEFKDVEAESYITDKFGSTFYKFFYLSHDLSTSFMYNSPADKMAILREFTQVGTKRRVEDKNLTLNELVSLYASNADKVLVRANVHYTTLQNELARKQNSYNEDDLQHLAQQLNFTLDSDCKAALLHVENEFNDENAKLKNLSADLLVLRNDYNQWQHLYQEHQTYVKRLAEISAEVTAPEEVAKYKFQVKETEERLQRLQSAKHFVIQHEEQQQILQKLITRRSYLKTQLVKPNDVVANEARQALAHLHVMEAKRASAIKGKPMSCTCQTTITIENCEADFLSRKRKYTCPSCETKLIFDDGSLKVSCATSESVVETKFGPAQTLKGLREFHSTLAESFDINERGRLEHIVKTHDNDTKQYHMIYSEICQLEQQITQTKTKIASFQAISVKNEFSDNELEECEARLTNLTNLLKVAEQKDYHLVCLEKHTTQQVKETSSDVISCKLKNLTATIEEHLQLLKNGEVTCKNLALRKENIYKFKELQLLHVDRLRIETDLQEAETNKKAAEETFAYLTLAKRVAVESSSQAISQFLNVINTHLQLFVNAFFPEDCPLTVSVSAFKKQVSKNSIVPQINVKLFYKDNECDFSNLSCGEKARVNLAFTLTLAELAKCPLILLDECTANLDETTTAKIFQVIREKYSHQTQKVCMITHHPLEEMS